MMGVIIAAGLYVFVSSDNVVEICSPGDNHDGAVTRLGPGAPRSQVDPPPPSPPWPKGQGCYDCWQMTNGKYSK